MPKPFDPAQEQFIREIVKDEISRAFIRRTREPRPELHVFTIADQTLACSMEKVVEMVVPFRTFTPVGVRSFNSFHDVFVTSVTDREDRDQVLMPFDSAAYQVPDIGAPMSFEDLREQLDHGVDVRRLYHPVSWGSSTKEAPIKIKFRSVGTPTLLPYLMWVIYGLVD